MAPTAAITKEMLSRHLVRLSLFPIFFILFFFLSPATLWVGLIRTAGQQTDKQKGVRESVAVCVVVWNKETRERERERKKQERKRFCCWFGRRDRVGVPPTHTHPTEEEKETKIVVLLYRWIELTPWLLGRPSILVFIWRLFFPMAAAFNELCPKSFLLFFFFFVSFLFVLIFSSVSIHWLKRQKKKNIKK